MARSFERFPCGSIYPVTDRTGPLKNGINNCPAIITEDRVNMKPRLIELGEYLREAGVSREDLLADPRLPISRIGGSQYIFFDDALRFEAWTKSQALYARAGQKPPQPDLRQRWSPNMQAA